jgi:transcriptional regulator with XRE-family HTH domain
MTNKFECLSKEEFLDIRIRLRLSQLKLARLLGLSVITVNRLENDRAEISRMASLAMRYLQSEYKPEVKPVRMPKNLRKSWENPDDRKASPTVVAPLRRKSEPHPESA